MDIEHHIHLRSFDKPNTTPILKALVVAFIIHSLLLIYLSSTQKTSATEIPDWINVKLIAGFENRDKKLTSNVTEQNSSKSKEIIKSAELKPLKNKVKKKYSDKKKLKQQNVKKGKSIQAKATTFIKADSRPYTLVNPKPIYPLAARRRGMQGVVLLGVFVNMKGYVAKVNILKTSGYKILDTAAVNSVENWRFIPAKNGEDAIESRVEVPIKFILNQS